MRCLGQHHGLLDVAGSKMRRSELRRRYPCDGAAQGIVTGRVAMASTQWGCRSERTAFSRSTRADGDRPTEHAESGRSEMNKPEPEPGAVPEPYTQRLDGCVQSQVDAGATVELIVPNEDAQLRTAT